MTDKPAITLLIPTMDRAEFLIRQLRYYQSVGFRGNICIGDSSSPAGVERMKKALGGFTSFNSTYREYPGVNDAECLKRLLDFVTTPYAALVADDDFLVPVGLAQCMQFLDQHPDYASAHGRALSLSLQSGGAHGRLAGAQPYGLPSLEGENAATRISAHFSEYAVTLFGVHRSETWRRLYRDIGRLPDRTLAAELLPCSLSVILGKVKQLDGLYLVRQGHPQRYYLPDKSDWVRQAEWPRRCETFTGLLAEALAQQDDIAPDEARKVVEAAFDRYLTGLLGAGWRQWAGHPRRGFARLSKVLRRVPGAAPLWRALHSRKPGECFEITPAALLDPAFSYHTDIMPVLRAMAYAAPEEAR